ncbi:MAG: heavy metal sensor histidine kinase [Anaerolineae bacterium]|jgi:two-component system heavy metal sensor histidine kinase CusS|nr:heavy metal sensor histidine kinase [Anaerolineae bacterium]
MLVSLVMVSLLACVGLYLDFAFASTLEERNRGEILGKVDLLRHVAARTRSEQQIVDDPHSFYEPMIGHREMYATVYGAAGDLLWSSSPIAPVVLSDHRIAPVNAQPEIRFDRDENEATPRFIRTALFAASLQDVRQPPLTILLELDVTASKVALSRYRETLLGTLVAAGLLGVLLAHAAVRMALRRLAIVGRALGELSVDRFDSRLSLESVPPELREHAIAYNAMVDRLQRAFRRMDEFASDLAHELRTPVNNLLLNAQIALTRTRSASDYRAALEGGIEELERLSRMVDDMLFLARADDARLTLRRESIALHEEAAKVGAFFEALADEARVVIDVTGRAIAEADRALMQRVLGNLISNAVRHSPPGGRVHVKVWEDGRAGATFSVSNAGDGISPEHLPHVFERFYRGDAARRATSEGAGLGLAIVKSIVDLHGGQIGVESVPGGRTVFKVRLPR